MLYKNIKTIFIFLKFVKIVSHFISSRENMKKFLFSSVLVASLVSSLFGADLLASLTNGKISDNSPGVKVLSLDEAKQVLLDNKVCGIK